MHVVAPARYQPRPQPRRRRPYAVIFLMLIVFGAAVNYLRPLPSATIDLSLHVPSAVTTPTIAWPTTGQAAVAAGGYGLLGTHGDQTPIATASVAKVITALCVLQKKPLSLGQTGPTFTIDAGDVDIYNSYVEQNGSVLYVEAGEQLSEYQALEALLIPSANNIADSLVTWVFGSQAAYNTYATNFARQHGLNRTHIGTDASGFDASTTSTASDVTTLGLLALQSPVLMQIANQTSVDLPVAGTVTNYNTVLGQAGITGLKTGNSDADPGAFVFTANSTLGGSQLAFTGAVLGAPDLDTALQDATQLSGSLQQGFEQVTVATSQQIVGHMHTAWGQDVPITTGSALSLVRWKATPMSKQQQLHPNARSGSVGSIKIAAGHATATTQLRLQHAVAGPSFWWRLSRH